ncbi:beta-CASP ribonuclease aCPSF1 [Haloarcula onubensis]|uniref:Transcription termination factor FttA n=1 Tax=Haloarcula onubensis TaxID=2950539 RepID=A0ABU2FLY0_9EURY|nr:beta-CASP ribonuclease aCPSF1 [Halomicroarcula sp. S3CR25-11]MDS0281181.1 beta-CASP ribonuclease aCPSF1 [Halomicroarcula sp. S3CR25-11]
MSTVDKQLENVRETIDEEVPRGITVTDVTYEGPELVIYTRDPKEFATDGDLVRRLASKLRKRITVRPDPDVLTPPDAAEDEIRDLVPEDADVSDIQFLADTGEVVIRAKQPGQVIGRRGETLREITKTTGWTPEVERTPAIDSPTVANVQTFLTQERDDRRDILERVGRQIHRDPMSSEEWVRVTTLGGCKEVGRAAYIISTADTRILVDCGDKPGERTERPYLDVPEAIGSGATALDAVVLTHAHLDHAALVPLLYENGYDGPIYCTEPTRDLLGLLTLDYIDSAAATGQVRPYGAEMVREAVKHCIPLSYGDVTDIAPDVKLTLHNAGHVLGSSVVHFHIGDGLYNVAFSGDIHYDSSRLLDGAVNEFPRVETLVLESTYGGRKDYQTDRDDSERKLKARLRHAAENDATVLVPTDAVGRPQELLVAIEEFVRSGDVPEIPVYMDEIIWEATAVHTSYPEFLRDDIERRLQSDDENPFLADQFTPVGDDDERRAVADRDEAAVVLSTPGMCTPGPVRTWLRALAPDADNTLVFVDHQARGTLGNRIQRGTDSVTLDGESVPLNLRVETIDGFSGHADRQGLENFVKTMHPRPEKVLCVDGDQSATQDLSSSLYHDYNLRTFTPENLETFRFI